jgi:lipopolysaccharide biosynthesis regulator YciM
VGTVLYRAGKYEQAVQQMKVGFPQNEWYYYPFLAMAYQRLGKTDEAKAWLQKSAANLKKIEQESWRIRAIMKLLHREAEALIHGPSEQLPPPRALPESPAARDARPGSEEGGT